MGQVVRPLVVRGNDVRREQVRSNPVLTKVQLFSDFAGGYLVSGSVAFHPYGEECGTHDHRGGVEMFFVMHGSGVIEVNGEAYSVSIGDCVLVPPGASHNVRGMDEENFTVFCVFVAAPGHEADDTPWVSTNAF